MGLRIRTNVTSVNAQRRLAKSTNTLQDSMAKLASGKRINKSADDAAGLAVSENLKADVRSLNMSKRNASDGVSMVQTAEGGLAETSNILIRLRELAIQAASDTIGNQEREFIDKEFLQLKDEIDRIANTTEFNGTRLLSGSSEPLPGSPDRPNSFPLEIQVGKDYYAESDGLDVRNPVNIIRLDFGTFNGYAGADGGLGIGTADEGTRVNNKANAQSSINTLDSAINKVNDFRSYLGAMQNRLQVSISNLDVQTENLMESKSRILDTDFASETAKLTQASILQQAGASILGQANQQPQIALSLLG